jgi:hypothetical protein
MELTAPEFDRHVHVHHHFNTAMVRTRIATRGHGSPGRIHVTMAAKHASRKTVDCDQSASGSVSVGLSR